MGTLLGSAPTPAAAITTTTAAAASSAAPAAAAAQASSAPAAAASAVPAAGDKRKRAALEDVTVAVAGRIPGYTAKSISALVEVRLCLRGWECDLHGLDSSTN